MIRMLLLSTMLVVTACSGGVGYSDTTLSQAGSVTINTSAARPSINGDAVGGTGASCNPSTAGWPACSKATIFIRQYVTKTIHIPAGNYTTPYIANIPNTEYILDGDITASSTAITIAANYVVINLNGYSVTYNQVSSGEGVNFDTWGRHDIAITNGSIIQGSALSEGDQYGRGNNPVTVFKGNGDPVNSGVLYPVDKLQIANLYIRYGGRDVGGIIAAGSYGLFEENTIEDMYEFGTMKNRHQGVVALTGVKDTAIANYNTYRNNTIINTRHRGIDVGNNSTTYGNHITTRAIATNANGIGNGSTNVAVYNNTIIARGEHSIGIAFSGPASQYVPMYTSNINIYNNYIDAQTTRLGTEYGASGVPNPNIIYAGNEAIGFRTTWGGNGINFHDNTIFVRSDSNYLGTYSSSGAPARFSSEARGIMSMLLNGETAKFQYNNITALDKDGTGTAKGIVVAGYDYGNGGNSSGLVFKGNSVTSNVMNIALGDAYGAATGWPLFLQNTLIKSGNYSSYATIGTDLGGYNVGTGKFVSNIFLNGAAENSLNMHWGNHNSETNAWKSIMFGRLMSATVMDGSGKVQSGIRLTTHNQNGDVRSVTYNVGTGRLYVNGVSTFTTPTNLQVVTDSNGTAQLIVYDYELNDIGTAQSSPIVNRIDFGPHSIEVGSMFTLPPNYSPTAWDSLTSSGTYKSTWNGKVASW